LSDDEQTNNKAKADRRAITQLSQDFELFLGKMIPLELKGYIKIDNMSNTDRVMRLPGTINYPKAEKRTNGQIEALAHVAVDYAHKSDILELRKKVPYATVAPRIAPKRPFVPRPNPKWPPYRKALFCAEWLRDHGNVDSNEVYAKEVLLPLIGSMHDGELTADEAEECFLEAVCGGERYGSPGRGMAFFKKQFKSHLGSRSSGHRTLGSLIGFCKSLGMKLPWTNEVSWEDSFQKQFKNYQSLKQ
jgi:hypothetical protein